jgi:hypothetical protein
LINRIKADLALGGAEIRVLSADGALVHVMSRAGVGASGSSGAPDTASRGSAASPATATATIPSAPLDQRGTRRQPRHKITGKVEVLLDGNVAALIDLSTVGAQVVSATILKPNQRVRMSLTDDVANVRCNAAVAWASFEIPAKSTPRYRAGLEFMDADGSAVDAFRTRHQDRQDKSLSE